MEAEEAHHHHFRIPVLLIGLLIGIGLTLATVFLYYQFFDRKETSKNQPQTLDLSISSPRENLAVDAPKLEVKGKTSADAIVTITLADQTYTLQTSNQEFSSQVNLKEGKNTITISAFKPDEGRSVTIIREVLYLNEDLTIL